VVEKQKEEALKRLKRATELAAAAAASAASAKKASAKKVFPFLSLFLTPCFLSCVLVRAKQTPVKAAKTKASAKGKSSAKGKRGKKAAEEAEAEEAVEEKAAEVKPLILCVWMDRTHFVFVVGRGDAQEERPLRRRAHPQVQGQVQVQVEEGLQGRGRR
jgi:hypothetical protein